MSVAGWPNDLWWQCQDGDTSSKWTLTHHHPLCVTRQVNPVISITNKVQNRQTVVVDICSSNFYEACNLEPSSILFGRWCSQLRSDSVVTAVYVYYNQEFLPRKQIIHFLKNVASRTHVNYSPSQHLHCMLGICSRGIKYWTWCHQFLTARAVP